MIISEQGAGAETYGGLFQSQAFCEAYISMPLMTSVLKRRSSFTMVLILLGSSKNPRIRRKNFQDSVNQSDYLKDPNKFNSIL